jgi:hypothetical protein
MHAGKFSGDGDDKNRSGRLYRYTDFVVVGIVDHLKPPSLFIAVRCCSLLFVVVRCCSLLFVLDFRVHAPLSPGLLRAEVFAGVEFALRSLECGNRRALGIGKLRGNKYFYCDQKIAIATRDRGAFTTYT